MPRYLPILRSCFDRFLIDLGTQTSIPRRQSGPSGLDFFGVILFHYNIDRWSNFGANLAPFWYQQSIKTRSNIDSNKHHKIYRFGNRSFVHLVSIWEAVIRAPDLDRREFGHKFQYLWAEYLLGGVPAVIDFQRQLARGWYHGRPRGPCGDGPWGGAAHRKITRKSLRSCFRHEWHGFFQCRKAAMFFGGKDAGKIQTGRSGEEVITF